jgi:hypothetical protein
MLKARAPCQQSLFHLISPPTRCQVSTIWLICQLNISLFVTDDFALAGLALRSLKSLFHTVSTGHILHRMSTWGREDLSPFVPYVCI